MMKSFMKSAICFPFGYINGQKYEDGQTGTNPANIRLDEDVFKTS